MITLLVYINIVSTNSMAGVYLYINENNLIIEGLLKFEKEIHGKHNIVHIRLKQLRRHSVSNMCLSFRVSDRIRF